MGESIELYQWIRHHEPLYLTKRDLQHLNLGDTFEVACFDGNFEEYYIWDNVPSNEIISPEQMFQENKITLTYTNDSPHSWDMKPVLNMTRLRVRLAGSIVKLQSGEPITI